MAFRIRSKKTVQESLQTVAVEQIDKAIEEILNDELDPHETVHQVRKRCKKLRGLIRLVRPVFERYQFENASFRDAARELSYARDAQSMVDCFDNLMACFEDYVDQGAFAAVRKELAQRRKKVADGVGLDEKLEEFLVRMREARRRAANWELEKDGFSALEGGLKKTYRRGRKALVATFESPSIENFHEWRKRVKYHWYHARLLRGIWPDFMKVWRREAHTLSNLLGDDHDLAILRKSLLDDADCFGSDSDLQVLFGLIDRRRAELQARSRPLGQRLFAEKPSQFCSRMASYCNTWKSTATVKFELGGGELF